MQPGFLARGFTLLIGYFRSASVLSRLKGERRGLCLTAGGKGSNMDENSFAPILLATLHVRDVPGCLSGPFHFPVNPSLFSLRSFMVTLRFLLLPWSYADSC